MKYMLLVHLAEDALDDAEREQCYVDSAKLTRDLHAAGQYVTAAPLHPVATARCVRVPEGRPLVTEGPFAETREQLGGFYLVDVETREEAIKIAARIPPATKGTIEVRPILEIDGLPAMSLRSHGDNRFMFLCYDDEEFWMRAGETVHRAAMDEAIGITRELDAADQYVLASPLAHSSTAVRVQVRDGETLVTDGPYAETNEILGGFYLVDVPTIDEAVRFAERHPGARQGGVEVRPLVTIPNLPED